MSTCAFASETHAALAGEYAPPLAAGEALFSLADARNLLRYGGLRPARDVLLFDPAHCYGLPEYRRLVDLFAAAGWPRAAFLIALTIAFIGVIIGFTQRGMSLSGS